MKIQSREKGKPRKIFSLNKDYAYIIPAMDGFAEKKLMELTEHHKAIIKIWFLENPLLQQQIERFYSIVEPHLSQINAIVVNQKEGGEVIVVSDKPKDIEKKILALSKDMGVVKFRFNTLQEIERMASQKRPPFSHDDKLAAIYDPNKIMQRLAKPKGG